jgi:hypothetical protein
MTQSLATWRRPAGCDTSACPEVYLSPFGGALIRSTRDEGSLVSFDTDEWAAFRAAVKLGEFDG